MKDRINDIVKFMIIASGVFVVLASFSVTRENAQLRADVVAQLDAPQVVRTDSAGHQ